MSIFVHLEKSNDRKYFRRQQNETKQMIKKKKKDRVSKNKQQRSVRPKHQSMFVHLRQLLFCKIESGTDRQKKNA